MEEIDVLKINDDVSLLILTRTSSDIMEDSNQVLYQQCYYGNACCRPVAGIQENVACDLHVQLQPIECRYSKKEQDVSGKFVVLF